MRLFTSVAALVLAACVFGCSTTQNSEVSAGAVGAKSGCCSAEAKAECTKTSPGAVGDKPGCRHGAAQASPGAVSEKSGCCKSKAGAAAEPAPQN